MHWEGALPAVSQTELLILDDFLVDVHVKQVDLKNKSPVNIKPYFSATLRHWNDF